MLAAKRVNLGASKLVWGVRLVPLVIREPTRQMRQRSGASNVQRECMQTLLVPCNAHCAILEPRKVCAGRRLVMYVAPDDTLPTRDKCSAISACPAAPRTKPGKPTVELAVLGQPSLILVRVHACCAHMARLASKVLLSAKTVQLASPPPPIKKAACSVQSAPTTQWKAVLARIVPQELTKPAKAKLPAPRALRAPLAAPLRFANHAQSERTRQGLQQTALYVILGPIQSQSKGQLLVFSARLVTPLGSMGPLGVSNALRANIPRRRAQRALIVLLELFLRMFPVRARGALPDRTPRVTRFADCVVKEQFQRISPYVCALQGNTPPKLSLTA